MIFLICGEMRLGFDAKRAFHNATGLGNYSRRLLASYSRQFSEDQLYLYHHKENQLYWKIPHGGNLHERFPSGKWKLFSSLWRSGGIVNDLRKDGIKLFHGLSNEIPSGLTKAGIRSVLSVHDLIFIRYPELYNQIDRRIYLKKMRTSLAEADLVLACSNQTAEDLQEFLGVKSDRIKTVYQDCDELFRIEKSPEFIKAVLHAHQIQGPYLVCVGTLEKRKNQLNLLRAFHQAAIPDLKLVFVGKKGDLFPEMQAFVNSSKLQNKVVFLERISHKELPALYQGAIAAAYVSHFEGFGIPVLEAMRSKIPVLVAKTSSLVEVGGDAVYYCHPNSIEEMVTGIQELVFNEGIRHHFIQKGILQAEKFNAEQLSKDLHQHYTTLL